MNKALRICEGSEKMLEKAIKRLNRHALKMGYSEAKVVSIGSPVEARRLILSKSEDGEVCENSYAVSVRDVVVDLPEQFLNYEKAEWLVLGQVVNAEGQAEVVAEAANMSKIGKVSEGFNWKCQTCKHSLGKAYVVEHKVDGRMLMVGHECLKQYTGADGQAIIAAIEFLAVLEYKDGDEGEGGGGGRGSRQYKVIDIEDYLAVCVAVAARDGGYAKRWVEDGDRDKAENPLCTRNHALAQFVGKCIPKKDNFGIDTDEAVMQIWSRSGFKDYPVANPSDADKAKARELVEAWLASEAPMKKVYKDCASGRVHEYVDGVCVCCGRAKSVVEGPDEVPDDYAVQCKFLAERGWVTEKTAGVAASMVKGPRKVEPKKDYSGSKHLGSVGGRQVFENLTVLMAIEREGNYGITTILKFADAEDNILTWFASGGRNYQKGDKVTLKATVKKHDDFRGIRQTVITRATEVAEKAAKVVVPVAEVVEVASKW